MGGTVFILQNLQLHVADCESQTPSSGAGFDYSPTECSQAQGEKGGPEVCERRLCRLFRAVVYTFIFSHCDDHNSSIQQCLCGCVDATLSCLTPRSPMTDFFLSNGVLSKPRLLRLGQLYATWLLPRVFGRPYSGKLKVSPCLILCCAFFFGWIQMLLACVVFFCSCPFFPALQCFPPSAALSSL